jgi:threonine/homoserine/homoserine lactone efflux protein
LKGPGLWKGKCHERNGDRTFLLAAVALLGSPGPGIAALLAVTRGGGLRAGLRYYAGLQVGLALAAGISAAGLFSLLAAFPVLLKAASIAAVLYLVWLAWKIGTAPVAAPGNAGVSASPIGGFFLGITNPKAYLAFASLMASTTLIDAAAPSDTVGADAALKWAIIVAVILVVDIAWVMLGAILHRTAMPARIERAMNIVFAASILLAALPALF